MIINRKKNAMRGTFYGIILKVIQILFPFVIRTIFIRTLGAEYLGLNSLFTAILQVLNLAELGISSALVFSMYRPIAYDDKEKLCQLLNLYRRYYRLIGCAVLGIGLLLIPFIPVLIKGYVPPELNIYILYAMHLTASVLSYWLLSYRSSLFAAHQRNDIISIISIVVYVCLYTLQAYVIIATRNYYLYLALAITAQILINLVTAFFSRKFFPDIKARGKLPETERKTINKRIRSLFTAKIGTVVNNSVDSIVISAMLGLRQLAVYQNYYYIISSIVAIFSIFFNALVAGVGNSLILKSKDQNRELLYNINHMVFLALSVCCACFVCMCQPFIQIWVGQENQLSLSFVFLFALYLFAELAPRILIVFKDAGGIWEHDKFRPLVAAGINLVLNMILTPIIGLYGIILSTVFALAFIAYPWLIVNINTRLFNIGIRRYMTRIGLYILVIVLGTAASYLICGCIHISSVPVTLAVRLVISVVVSTCVFAAAFWRLKETKYLLDNLVSIKKKLIRWREHD